MKRPDARPSFARAAARFARRHPRGFVYGAAGMIATFKATAVLYGQFGTLPATTGLVLGSMTTGLIAVRRMFYDGNRSLQRKLGETDRTITQFNQSLRSAASVLVESAHKTRQAEIARAMAERKKMDEKGMYLH